MQSLAFDKISAVRAIKEYRDALMMALVFSFPDLDVDEIEAGVDYSIQKRFKNQECSIENNYKKTKINGTLVDVLNYIDSKKPILTSSGVMFEKHADCRNPLSEVIMGFIIERKRIKKEMFKYPKGSDMFTRLNLGQLLQKLNANACYGTLGAATCLLYNIFVAEAITRQGRSYISCSMTLFESLLANNIKFNNLNEIITFINNIVNERNERQFSDSLVIDENITAEEAFYKVMITVDLNIWNPTNKELQLVWDYVSNLDQEDLNRLYYKNNIYSFCENKIVKDLISKILCELKTPFMDPNNPPEEIRDDLDLLVKLIYEFVYYHYFYIDKLDRIEYMERKVVAITDTDSTIISFDAWYHFVEGLTKDDYMPIRYWKYDMVKNVKIDQFGDKDKIPMVNYVKKEEDYNFYTEEVTEYKCKRQMVNYNTQDCVKYSIVNICGYICSKLVVDYLERYTKLCGSYVEGTPCRMVMKNEFYFLRALLTPNKRNYADLQMLQEGNIIPESNRLAIAGLPIDKATLSDDIKKGLQSILHDDILVVENIDQNVIIKKLAIMEKKIYNSIMNGETKYYKPDDVGSITSYDKDPMQVNGITAIVMYNAMRDNDMPALNLEERNRVIKIKLDITNKNVHNIKDTHPEHYNKLISHIERVGIKKVQTLALPLDVPVPDWVMGFIDTSEIINDNLSNMPIESIGLQRLNNDNINYSNIINL